MRNMMRFGVLAILLTALILPLLEAAAAQVAPPANVHLRVVDSQTGKDIPGALVRFTDAKGESPGFDQGVDKEGIVEIYLNDGRYQVTGMSSDDTYDKNLLLLDVHGNGSTLLDQAGQAFPDEEQGIIKLDPIGATVAAPDNQVDTYVYQNPDDPDNPEAFSTASELEAANQLVANHIIDSPSQAFCGLVRNVTLHDVLRSRRSGNAVIWVHYESFGPVTLYRCQPAPGFTFRGQDGRLLQEAYVERPCSNVIIPAGTVPPKPEVPVTPPPYVPEKTPTPEVPSTETPVPTVTPTQVVTPTETPETPTSTPTEEITPTPTEEVTATPTETPVCTECTPPSTPVPTPTESASPTPTEVFINTPTPTEEVTPTPTKPVCTECTPPSTPVPTPTESASPTPTEVFNTPTPEATATVPLSTATVVQPTTTPMPTATESGCVGCKTPEIPVATNTPYVGSTPTPVFSTATQVVPTATESGCLGCVDPITPVPTATQSANPTPTSVFGEESQVGQQSDLTNSSNNDDGEAMIENVVGGTVSFEMDATTTPEESGQVSNDSVADSTDGSINDTSQPEGVVSNDNQTSSEASIDGSDNSDTVDSQTTNDTDNTDIGDSDSNNQFVDVKTAGSSDGDETIVTDTSNGEDNDSGVIAFIESPDTGDDSGGDSEGNEGAVESSQTISNDTSNGDAGDLTVDDSGADVGTDTSSGGTTDAPPADSGADDSSAVASPALLGILLGVIALVILGWSLTKRVDRLEAASNTISINLAPPDSQRRTPLRRQSRKE